MSFKGVFNGAGSRFECFFKTLVSSQVSRGFSQGFFKGIRFKVVYNGAGGPLQGVGGPLHDLLSPQLVPVPPLLGPTILIALIPENLIVDLQDNAVACYCVFQNDEIGRASCRERV